MLGPPPRGPRPGAQLSLHDARAHGAAQADADGVFRPAFNARLALRVACDGGGARARASQFTQVRTGEGYAPKW